MNSSLLEVARANVPADYDASQCWHFVVKGIEVGWLGVPELLRLKKQLDELNDYGVEELLFANREDGTIKVVFLDDSWTCSVQSLRDALAKLVAAVPS